ncbi:DNA-binding response regulator [Mediterraneibacter gnavus]|uniref:Stage 0 sporulation protein A homolog n=1 Tax=Mediterraneibacter gnavus TaxID=33038 RepID=A0A3E4UV52_MEDGN|nr:DNA-binding response regulator [Mediterraneibacter gnavus]
MRKDIIIIDDDRDLCTLLQESLLQENICADISCNGFDGIKSVKDKEYQLVVLDVMMPGISGFEVLERIRDMSNVPILMLTAKDDSASKVKGLRAGADDYLTKPFEMEEFFARVLSLIRRYTRLNNMASKEILKYGDLRIDLESGIVELSGEELKLSAKEYDVLIYLAKNQGKILTKKQIYENVWNEEYVYDDDNIMAVISRLRKIMAVISRLRKKIERTAENSYIQTVRGLGYRFNKEL